MGTARSLLICAIALAAMVEPAFAHSTLRVPAVSYPAGAPISVRAGLPCPGRPSCFAPGVPACAVCCKTYQTAVCVPGEGKTSSCYCSWE
jgi:hypothetical protein